MLKDLELLDGQFYMHGYLDGDGEMELSLDYMEEGDNSIYINEEMAEKIILHLKSVFPKLKEAK